MGCEVSTDVPAGCSGRVFRQGVPAGCSSRVFRQGVPAGCSGRVFRQGVPAGCSGRVFQQGVPAGCSGRVFRQVIKIQRMLYPLNFFCVTIVVIHRMGVLAQFVGKGNFPFFTKMLSDGLRPQCESSGAICGKRKFP